MSNGEHFGRMTAEKLLDLASAPPRRMRLITRTEVENAAGDPLHDQLTRYAGLLGRIEALEEDGRLSRAVICLLLERLGGPVTLSDEEVTAAKRDAMLVLEREGDYAANLSVERR